MRKIAFRCMAVLVIKLMLLPGMHIGAHAVPESRSLRASPQGTRLYLLRHTDRIDFADHQWVGSSRSELKLLDFTSWHWCMCAHHCWIPSLRRWVRPTRRMTPTSPRSAIDRQRASDLVCAMRASLGSVARPLWRKNQRNACHRLRGMAGSFKRHVWFESLRGMHWADVGLA